MSHNIVILKIMFLGNVFGEFPKSKVPETLDFTGFPNLFPEINENRKPKNIFGEMGKSVFGRICHFQEIFLFWENEIWENEIYFWEKSQQK